MRSANLGMLHWLRHGPSEAGGRGAKTGSRAFKLVG